MPPSKERPYVTGYVRQRVNKIRAKLDLLKLERGCYDCGGMFPAESLDWDHLPGTIKELSISKAASLGQSLETILAEIDKCQCVCANCHRVRTRKRQTKNA